MPRATREMVADDAFRAIARRDRRRLLVSLAEKEQNEKIVVPDWFRAPDCDVETGHVMLEHNHLPLLDELELISWNRDDSTVSAGANFDAIRPLLELLDEHRDKLPGHWI